MHTLENSTKFAETAQTGCNMDDLTFVDIPTEIQLTILGLLDVQSLLAIRQVRNNPAKQIFQAKLLFRLAGVFVNLRMRDFYGCRYLNDNGNIFPSLTIYSIRKIPIIQTFRPRCLNPQLDKFNTWPMAGLVPAKLCHGNFSKKDPT